MRKYVGLHLYMRVFSDRWGATAYSGPSRHPASPSEPSPSNDRSWAHPCRPSTSPRGFSMTFMRCNRKSSRLRNWAVCARVERQKVGHNGSTCLQGGYVRSLVKAVVAPGTTPPPWRTAFTSLGTVLGCSSTGTAYSIFKA